MLPDLLRGRARAVALAAVVMVAFIALFSRWYVMVPLLVAAIAVLQWSLHRWRSTTRLSAATAPSTADSWRRP